MLKLIGFDNYRVFNKETILNLRQLTVLTGPNSSGKSSVIKAVKLFKQNTPGIGYGGLPYNLSFVHDENGHFLGEYKRILNSHNFSKGDDSLSFTVSIELPSLGDCCACKLSYKQSPSNSTSAILNSFSILTRIKGKWHKLVKLVSETGINENDGFDRILVDFKLMKNIFEEQFIPLLEKINEEKENNKDELNLIDDNIYNDDLIENLPRFDFYTDKFVHGKMHSFPTNYQNVTTNIEKWLRYNPDLPILPFYKVITGELIVDKSDFKDKKHLKTYLGLLDQVKMELSNAAGFKITPELAENQLAILYKHLRSLENDFFSYILKRKLHFPFELIEFMDRVFFMPWAGVVYDNTVEGVDWVTSEETKNALIQFPIMGNLIILYQLHSGYEMLYETEYQESNAGIFYEFIKQTTLDSIDQFPKIMQMPYFYDSNRIEQTLFYHPTNSRIGYNLIVDFLNSDEYSFSVSQKKVASYLKKLSIADDFEIISQEFGIYTINLIKGKAKKALSDHGYGITKLFFLLIALNNYKILFIEEPETNLHPDLQAKLADIIADYLDNEKRQVIIETHSEYFIRKLQYLVATNKIDKDNLLINYFNPSALHKSDGLLKEIKIKRDGSLDGEFGPGFYDEAASLIGDLFRLTSYN